MKQQLMGIVKVPKMDLNVWSKSFRGVNVHLALCVGQELRNRSKKAVFNEKFRHVDFCEKQNYNLENCLFGASASG